MSIFETIGEKLRESKSSIYIAQYYSARTVPCVDINVHTCYLQTCKSTFSICPLQQRTLGPGLSVNEMSLDHEDLDRRKIRLIEGNAKCRPLKN